MTNNDEREAPEMNVGKSADIPVPSLGTPEPSGPIPEIPLTGEVSEPSPRQRRRGKRPSSETQVTPPVVESETQSTEAQEALSLAMTNAFRVVFSIAAAVRGDHWNITDRDAESLGITGAAALGPYMGQAAKWMPLAIFGLNVAGVALPRLQRDAQIAKELAAKDGKPQAPVISVLP